MCIVILYKDGTWRSQYVSQLRTMEDAEGYARLVKGLDEKVFDVCGVFSHEDLGGAI